MTKLGRIFCFGLGYSALALAQRLSAEGWGVAGTSRTGDKCRALGALGIAAFVFDGARKLADFHAALSGVTHILASAPPDAAGDPVLARHGDDLKAMKGVEWIGYLSTTGVYGDRQGGWVDETGAREPTGERGRRRVAAEDAWQGLHRMHGSPVHIFRLAGIYGPGRSAIDTVKRGQARRIDKPGQVFSRVHVDDIAGVLRASILRPNPGAVYNVCDDDPAPPEKVIEEACRLLGAPAPPLVRFDEAKSGMSEMARSFYDDNKRVSNGRIKNELGVVLKFPSYKDGLAALKPR